MRRLQILRRPTCHPRPGQRMLLIDAGTGAEADHTDVQQSGRATPRRLFGIRRFSFELTLKSLDVEPANLLHPIGHHSLGRSPDLSPGPGPTSRAYPSTPTQPQPAR